MQDEEVVDMFQTVKMLHTQRPAMVQTQVRTRPIYFKYYSKLSTLSEYEEFYCFILGDFIL